MTAETKSGVGIFPTPFLCLEAAKIPYNRPGQYQPSGGGNKGDGAGGGPSSGGAGAGTLTGGSLCLDKLGGGEGLLSGVDHLQMEDTPPTEFFTHDAGQGTALGFGDDRHFKGGGVQFISRTHGADDGDA